MKKTLKTAIALILFLILCTSSVNAFQFNGNMEVPGFIVDGIIYKHSPGSTDVEMEGTFLQGNLKTLYIPETVKNEGKLYTVTNIFFDDYIDGFPECVYTIDNINVSKNLKEFVTDTVYRSKPGAWQNLKTINIPKDAQLKSIGYFKNCPKLKSVYIPASVKSIGFKNCPNLKMTVSKDNPKYKMRNTRYLCSKNGKTAYEYFGKQKSVTIPKGITALYGTYSDNKYIKKVTIPSSVKTIKGYTFSNCKGLSKVIIKNEKKAPKISKKTRYNITDKVFENTKKGIKFYVKNKKVAKSLKKQLKGSGVKKAKILVGKKVVYKNVK